MNSFFDPWHTLNIVITATISYKKCIAVLKPIGRLYLLGLSHHRNHIFNLHSIEIEYPSRNNCLNGGRVDAFAVYRPATHFIYVWFFQLLLSSNKPETVPIKRWAGLPATQRRIKCDFIETENNRLIKKNWKQQWFLFITLNIVVV